MGKIIRLKRLQTTGYTRLDTFRAAEINTVVISIDNESMIGELVTLGCRVIGECKVFRRETELYAGSLEILKGIRVML